MSKLNLENNEEKFISDCQNRWLKAKYCPKQDQLINPITKNGNIECLACYTYDNDKCYAYNLYLKEKWLEGVKESKKRSE